MDKTIKITLDTVQNIEQVALYSARGRRSFCNRRLLHKNPVARLHIKHEEARISRQFF